MSRRVTGFDGSGSVSDGLDENEILVAELRIMQTLDSEGQIHVYDCSQSNDGSELEPAKALELLEWARASVLAPMVWGMMNAFAVSEDEDE